MFAMLFDKKHGSKKIGALLQPRIVSIATPNSKVLFGGPLLFGVGWDFILRAEIGSWNPEK